MGGMPRTRLSLPLFLLAEASSLFGNSAISIVLPWLVLARTGDPAAAGLVATISSLPAILATLVGGHLIDLIGRRRIAVLADCGSAISVAALAIVDAVVGLNLGWFIALGVLGALFDVPGMTARQTLIANVSEATGISVERISGLRQTVFGLSFLAGPGIAGALMAVLDPIRVVWLTAGCSALAALCTALMPLAGSTNTPAAEADRNPLSGFHLIRRDRGLFAMLLIGSLATIPVAPLLGVILPAHFQRMGAPTLLGVTLSAYAVGTVAGSVLWTAGMSRWRWPTWLVANLLLGGSFFLIATLAGFWPVAVGIFLAGLGGGLVGPMFTVAMTEKVPDALRGRVMAVYGGMTMLGAPIGLGLMSMLLVGGSIGVGAWVCAIAYLPVLVYSLVAPGLRDFVVPPVEPEPEPVEDAC